MSSNLKVNTILPSTGTNVAIGTAGGSITMVGNVDIDINSGISTFNDIHISDKIVHVGDTNTSIRFPAADTISFETGGSERLRITSAGLVGIGTDISGAGGAYGRLSVVIPSQSGGSALQVMNSAAGSSDGDLTNIVLRSVNNSGAQWAGAEYRAHEHIFKNQGTEALRITSDGKIGIGTTNPAQLMELASTAPNIRLTDTVYGHAEIDGNSADLKFNADKGNTKADSKITFFVDNTERFRIDSDGELLSNCNNNGQIIHTFSNLNDTASSSAMTVEHHFNFNRTSGAMSLSGARIVAGKEREWVGAAANQDGYFAVHTTADETSAEKMRISSGGIMTRPYQPAFSAQGLAAPVDSSEGYTGILSNYMQVIECNIGGHYKASGTDVGKFVAPVAGNYFFSAMILFRLRSGSNANGEVSFYKNNTNISARSLGYTYVVGTNDHDSIHITSIISLAAGDKVHFGVHNCSSGGDWYWGSGLGNFHGYLIG